MIVLLACSQQSLTDQVPETIVSEIIGSEFDELTRVKTLPDIVDYDFAVLDKNEQPQGIVTAHARKEHFIQIAGMQSGTGGLRLIQSRTSDVRKIFADSHGKRYTAAIGTPGARTSQAICMETGESIFDCEYLDDNQTL